LLHNNSTRTVKAVGKLFSEIAPRSANRNGGYTRVVKLGPRPSDSAPMAFIEWVDLIAAEPSAAEPEKKGTKKAPNTVKEDKSAKP
jgi:large subunit ribosomal protein L17